MPCTICNDQGYKKVRDANGFEEYAICDCHKAVIDKRIMLNKLADSHIPKHFWHYELPWYKEKFATMALSRVRDQLVGFVEDPEAFLGGKQSLWLFSEGLVKSYKTSLAIQLGKSLMAHHKVKFLSFRKLVELFLDFDNKKEAKALIQSYLGANVIIVDDMFDVSRAPTKEYQAILLYGFIEDCINADILFICTSNKSIEDYSKDKLFAQSATLLSYESMQIQLPGA
jgi:DNA replication protein DnaC